MSLLAIEDLTITTPGRDLVSHLSLRIAPGQRLGLIGESGSGKSLTALAAIGLLPRGMTTSGSVRLADTEIVGASDRDLVSLRGTVTATVFQEPLTALDPLLRIDRQVAEPLRRRARRDGRNADVRREVFALLEQVAIAEPDRIARAYPHEISGGQRQRVAIAMALACRPQLLIADEAEARAALQREGHIGQGAPLARVVEADMVDVEQAHAARSRPASKRRAAATSALV
jgi:peptide/nickel transport system ATP-binding protein